MLLFPSIVVLNIFVLVMEHDVSRSVSLFGFVSGAKFSATVDTATLLPLPSMPRDMILLLAVQMKPRTVATHRASTKSKEKGIKRIDTPVTGTYMMHSRAHHVG